MKYLWAVLSLAVMLSVCSPAQAETSCGNYWTFLSEGYDSTHVCGVAPAFTKTVFWRIYWKDGHSEDHWVRDAGTSNYQVSPCAGCWPAFNTPYFEENSGTANWVQETQAGTVTNGSCSTVVNHMEARMVAHLRVRRWGM
jgi:hypothetical protein